MEDYQEACSWPRGVRGRNSDNTKLREILKWAPEISLEKGLALTYAWIENQVKEKYAKKIAAEALFPTWLMI